MLLFLRDLIKIKNIYRREHGIDVDFYTVNVKERKLVSLKEFLKLLYESSMYPRENMEFEEAKKVYEYRLDRKLDDEEVVKLYKEDCIKHGWNVVHWCRT